VVDNSADIVTESAGEGMDTVRTTVDHTLAANIENLAYTGLVGWSGSGNELANIITGGAANDMLSGMSGNDVLRGGAGNDTIAGGFGADQLTGGLGADRFDFRTFENAAFKDTITDFVHGTDLIGIDRAAFTAFAADPAGTLDISAFALGIAATTANQHLIYNQASGALYYDADGVGGTAQIQIAALSGRPLLDAMDFVLL